MDNQDPSDEAKAPPPDRERMLAVAIDRLSAIGVTVEMEPGDDLGLLEDIANAAAGPGGEWHLDTEIEVIAPTPEELRSRQDYPLRRSLLRRAREGLDELQSLTEASPVAAPHAQRLRAGFLERWEREASRHLALVGQVGMLAETAALADFTHELQDKLKLPRAIPAWLELSRLLVNYRRRRERAKTPEAEVKLAREKLEQSRSKGKEASLLAAVIVALEREADSRCGQGAGQGMPVQAAIARHQRDQQPRPGRREDHAAQAVYRGLGELWAVLSGKLPGVRGARPRGRDWQFLVACVKALSASGCSGLNTHSLAKKSYSFRGLAISGRPRKALK